MSRRYSEAEVREILERATREEGPALPGPRDGLSLEQIQEIAAEVGIDPMRVERAAHSLSVVRTRGTALAGGATSLRVERRVDQTPDGVSTGEILDVIREGMGRAGNFLETDELFEWKSDGELGKRMVTLSRDADGTLIRGMAELSNAAVVTFLPAGLLGTAASIAGFLQAANAANEGGMVFFAVLLPTVFVGLRAIFARFSRAELSKLDRVTGEVAQLIAERGGAVDES